VNWFEDCLEDYFTTGPPPPQPVQPPPAQVQTSQWSLAVEQNGHNPIGGVYRFGGSESYILTLTHPAIIDGSNSRGTVHQRVRNAYWWVKYRHCKQEKIASHCRICRMGLIPEPPQLPVTYQLPCCKTHIHSECRVNWAMCPVCSVAFTALKCCVCLGDIDPGPNYLDSWQEQKKYRTPCCFCDMHKECVPNSVKCASGFQGWSVVCPICLCALTDDGANLRTELWEALDYIFQRQQQDKNKEGRRNVTQSLQPSPNFSPPEKWTGPLPRRVV